MAPLADPVVLLTAAALLLTAATAAVLASMARRLRDISLFLHIGHQNGQTLFDGIKAANSKLDVIAKQQHQQKTQAERFSGPRPAVR